MIYLASSSDEVKIWDVPTFSLLEQFNPFEGCVSDLTWSHDGCSIASCCSTDYTVHIRLTKTTHSVPSESFVLPAACQCLDYNSSSRFLLCGCVDGSVHIYDRKLKSIKKSYQNLKNPVTVARWNWNDSYISVGLENGNILLYNVTTGQTSNPLVAPTVNTIRQLKYNPYQKSSLVSASDDGAVNFWDTNVRKLTHAFTKTHQAAVRDFTFSPINDCLMVSVGLDKRAVFYDVQSKSSIKTLVAEHPLTSVDMMQDGTTVVVGTTKGKIFFYDMRQSTSPVINIPAHKSSVKHLSFVKKDSDKNDSSSLSSSQHLHRHLPATPVSSFDVHNLNSNNSIFQSPRNNTQLNDLIFSPLGHGNKSSNSVAEKTSSEKSWMQNMSKSLTGDIFTTGDNIFSPHRQDNSQSINSTHNVSSFLGNNSFLTQVLGPVETVNQESVSGQHTNVNNFVDILHSDKAIPASINGETAHGRKSSSMSPRDRLSSSQFQNPPLQAPASRDTSLLVNKTLPEHHKTSSDLLLFHTSPQQGLTTLTDLQEEAINRSHSSKSMNRAEGAGTSLSLFTERNGIVQTSPPRSSNTPQLAATRPFPEAPSPSSLSAVSATSSVRHLVQDLLREQFQEHQEQLKAEIRVMLGHPDHNTLPTSQMTSSAALTSQSNPGLFHAEYIRNLVREELEDVKEFIHKEFWCVQVELIKQIFQLQKKMEAGLAECMINPLLLDEIHRLREENARLKKTY